MRRTPSIPQWLRCAGCFASLVLASNSLAAQAEAPWRLVPDLRIDGTTNDLTFITGISVRRSGEIFIAQPHDNSIKVFSSIGVPVRTIGRKGEGPGELTGLGNIGFVGDTLYATDFRQRRVILFTHDGRVVRTIKMSPMNVEALKRDTMASRYRGLVPMGLSANNKALAIPSVSSSDMAEGRIVALPVLRVGWDGAPQKRLALLPRAHGTLGITHGSGTTYMSQPFADDPLFALSHNLQPGFTLLLTEPRDVRQQRPLATRHICQGALIAQDKRFRSVALFEQGLISGQFLFGQINAFFVRRDLGTDPLHLSFDLLFALTQNVVLALIELQAGGKQELLIAHRRSDLGVADSRH